MKTLVKVALPLLVVTRTDEAGIAYVRFAKDGNERPVGKVEDVLPSDVIVWTEVEGFCPRAVA